MDTSIFLNPWRAFAVQLAEFLPKLIGAFVILIVGWMLAKMTEVGIRKSLRMLRVDALASKSGVDAFLKQGGLEHTAVDILALLVYWILMLMVILIALNGVGLQTASDLMNKIILYIPNVIVAVFVLIMGLFFARFLEGVLSTYLKNTGVQNARLISQVGRYAIVVFVVSVALDQLNIGKELVVSTFQIAFGAVCLALALSFGLGGKEWAAGVITRMHPDKNRRRR